MEQEKAAAGLGRVAAVEILDGLFGLAEQGSVAGAGFGLGIGKVRQQAESQGGAFTLQPAG
ncbi:MAG: hypothetical protein A2004_06470 [Spirochaetes bacterium GWC1_61_12]|nr:MAG: hypothetical protein A2004_06470 [Spirochaetes bacterium GWC1_61_12]OHD59629.1 MAG: hypothetical protein A2Y32_12145 [Spirochaetes bacterium GWF1_60_12]